MPRVYYVAQQEHLKSKCSLLPESSAAQWIAPREAVCLVVWPFNPMDRCIGSIPCGA